MRLTLRTMLAYLDGILSSDDAQEISKKIEESSFASDLIHRIRDLMRRPSITAPDPDAPGPSLGPNAMAEYLDNTLPPARVTEFEKICLESDIYLAEVSACHQILTLVLGEPAEIEPTSRQRMYDIHAQDVPPIVDEIPEIPIYSVAQTEQIEMDGILNSTDSQAEIVIPPPIPALSTLSTNIEKDKKPHTRPTIPEYLREPTKKYRWVSIATASVVGICVLLLALFVFGRFEPGTTMGNMLVSVGIVKESKQVASETKNTLPVHGKSDSETAAKQPKSEEKAIGGESTQNTPSTAKAPTPTQPPAESIKPSGTEQATAAASPPGDTEKQTTSEKSNTQPGSASETSATGKAAEPEAATQSGASPTSVDKNSNKGETAVQKPANTLQTQTSAEPAEIETPSADAKTSEEKTLPPAEQVGRFMSDDQLLLASSGTATDWQRVPSKGFLTANEHILALPTYRADITIDTSVKLQMLGGTELELLPGNSREPEGIKIHFGRFVITPLANAGTKLRVITGERVGVITFVDPDAIVAAEVRRIHTPGVNPETETSHITAEFFVTLGHVVWDETGQKSLNITAPARFAIDNQLPPEVAASKDLPKWIAAEPISPIDRRASVTMTQELLAKPPTRPAQRGLMELADKHRQKEVRWLAVRCLGYIGYFDPMVTVLDDAASKQEWGENINQLRDAVGRDPETALAVRKALESRYSPEAADMYRMLWGYSDKNLESGDDEKLVKHLEDENLALRVLSCWNLKEITGKGQFFQPEQPIAKRQQPVRSWKKSLENKEIRIKPAEEKISISARETPAPPPANDNGP
jgi:hypothetical protein